MQPQAAVSAAALALEGTASSHKFDRLVAQHHHSIEALRACDPNRYVCYGVLCALSAAAGRCCCPRGLVKSGCLASGCVCSRLQMLLRLPSAHGMLLCWQHWQMCASAWMQHPGLPRCRANVSSSSSTSQPGSSQEHLDLTCWPAAAKGRPCVACPPSSRCTVQGQCRQPTPARLTPSAVCAVRVCVCVLCRGAGVPAQQVSRCC